MQNSKGTDRNACRKYESRALADGINSEKGSNSEQLQYKLGNKKTFHTYTDADISHAKRQKPGFLPGDMKAYPDWTNKKILITSNATVNILL